MEVYDQEVNNQKRIFNLDVLRALAIVLVFVCHLISIVVVFAITFIQYKYFEKPMTSIREKFQK